MLEDSYFEPKGADFLLWGLVSPLACGGFSVSRQGFQTTKPRQSTRIHLLQSGSGAEREDSKLAWGQQVAPLAPRRQLRTPPLSACQKNKCGLVVAESPVTDGSGLDRGGDERAQETQANDAGYPSTVSYTHLTLPTICSV